MGKRRLIKLSHPGVRSSEMRENRVVSLTRERGVVYGNCREINRLCFTLRCRATANCVFVSCLMPEGTDQVVASLYDMDKLNYDGGTRSCQAAVIRAGKHFRSDLDSPSRPIDRSKLLQPFLSPLAYTHTTWSFPDLPCAASQLPVSSALLPVLPLVLLPEEVTPAATVTLLPAATSHGKPLTMPQLIQLDRH